MFNSLGQTLLKIAAPGVPDIYQGTEFWDLSFVDPDNRRPVDFAERRQLLDELKRREAKDRPGLLRDLLPHWQDGRIKLYLILQAARLSPRHPELLLDGEYLPLAGHRRDEAIGFALLPDAKARAWAVAVVPRLIGDDGLSRRTAAGSGVLALDRASSAATKRRATGSTSSAANDWKRRPAATKYLLAAQAFSTIFRWRCFITKTPAGVTAQSRKAPCSQRPTHAMTAEAASLSKASRRKSTAGSFRSSAPAASR